MKESSANGGRLSHWNAIRGLKLLRNMQKARSESLKCRACFYCTIGLSVWNGVLYLFFTQVQRKVSLLCLILESRAEHCVVNAEEKAMLQLKLQACENNLCQMKDAFTRTETEAIQNLEDVRHLQERLQHERNRDLLMQQLNAEKVLYSPNILSPFFETHNRSQVKL